ncbi:MAG: hypothetical protein WBV73_23350, partial [Phormidium sp.]
YEEWFETVENSEAEENIEPIIEIVKPPEIVVQEVVQGKRKPKNNPASGQQMTLFNLSDFT